MLPQSALLRPLGARLEPRVSDALALFLALVAFAPGEARAYLDPGSGSVLLQVLLGGLAGAAVFFRMLWQRLRRRLGASTPQAGETPTGTEPPPSATDPGA